MRSPRAWWSIYAACAGVVIVALVWITATLVGLEHAGADARADARYQESLRLALWRMDSWLSPQLAREAARPSADYQSYYAERVDRAAAGLVGSGGDFVPSPLLDLPEGIFRLHFQLSADDELTSPQVPVGGFRELAEASHLTISQVDSSARLLARLRSALSPADLAARLTEDWHPLAPDVDLLADTEESETLAMELAAGEEDSRDQSSLNVKEFSQRLRSTSPSFSNSLPRSRKSEAMGDYGRDADIADALLAEEVAVAALDESWRPSSAPTTVVGPLQPIWLDGFTGDGRELVFFRRVLLDDQTYYQGFLCDWPRIRTALLAQIRDLFEGADLTPRDSAPQSESDLATLLTAVPASLQAAMFSSAPVNRFSPTRLTLLISWLAVLGGLVAVAVTLRSIVVYGEKRSRFASAVTHELRTPLTTFRMYTEMLSTDMVRDEDKRRAYLATLHGEATRLSVLVENVLEFSRLEEGRRPARIETLGMDELLSSVMPPLERRCEEAGLELRETVTIDRDGELRTDATVVGQILLNLVDNACKYAGDEEGGSIEVEVLEGTGTLLFHVRDNGEGVPADQASLIFSPFERGTYQSSAKPGIGLGLSLSRGLARNLGGDLVLETGAGPGACFTLSLPG